MKSDNVKEQIEAAQAKQRQLATAREVLGKRVTFLTMQAESLEYPAGQGDKQALQGRAAMLGELEELNQKIRANELEAEAVSGNVIALRAEYNAARLAEEAANRDRAALAVIACKQEIIKHRQAMQALTDGLPAMQKEVENLNGIVVKLGGRRVEVAPPAGSDEIKTAFYEDTRVLLQGALS